MSLIQLKFTLFFTNNLIICGDKQTGEDIQVEEGNQAEEDIRAEEDNQVEVGIRAEVGIRVEEDIQAEVGIRVEEDNQTEEDNWAEEDNQAVQWRQLYSKCIRLRTIFQLNNNMQLTLIT